MVLQKKCPSGPRGAATPTTDQSARLAKKQPGGTHGLRVAQRNGSGAAKPEHQRATPALIGATTANQDRRGGSGDGGRRRPQAPGEGPKRPRQPITGLTRKGGNSILRGAHSLQKPRVPDFILTAGRVANNVVSLIHDAVCAIAYGEGESCRNPVSYWLAACSWLGWGPRGDQFRGNDGY
jgi:hypothetical protein